PRPRHPCGRDPLRQCLRRTANRAALTGPQPRQATLLDQITQAWTAPTRATVTMFVRKRRQARPTLAGGMAQAHGRARPVRQAARRPAHEFSTWVTLALLAVGSVGSLQSAPALAVFGLASVFLYLLPAAVFLLPITLVAAELASGWQGGVYNWVEQGISAPM